MAERPQAELRSDAPAARSLPSRIGPSRVGPSRIPPSLIGIVAGVALALWLTDGAWGPRLPAGGDTIGHLVRAQWGLGLFGHLHLDSWYPRFGVGAQTYLVDPPGFDMGVALLRVGTLGVLSAAGAVKVIEILVIVAMVPAGWYLARSFGLDRAAAGTVSVLILGVDSFFGVGFKAMFGVGLVPEQMAAPLWCVSVGAAWRLCGREPNRRDVAVGIGAVAALVLVHPTTALILVVLMPSILLLRLLQGSLGARQVGLLGVTALAAGALVAFWAVPFVVHRSLGGPTAQFAIASWSSQLGDIARGHLVFGPVLAPLVLAAAAGALVLAGAGAGHGGGRLRPPAEAAWLAIGLFASIHAIKHWAPNSNAGLILGDRALGHVGVLALIPLGWWCTTAVKAMRVDGATASVAAVAIAVVVVGASYHWHQQGAQAGAPTRAFLDANAALRRVVPPQARVAVERSGTETTATGVEQPNLWVAELSGRNVLNVFFVEGSASSGLGYTADQIATADPVDIARRLSRLGVTDVLSVDQATADRYVATRLFRRVWTEGGLSVLNVAPPAGQPPPATMLSVGGNAGRLQALGPGTSAQHLRWQVSAGQAESVTVALGWNPAWHVSLDGHSVPLERDPQGPLVRVLVPAGRHRLALDYRADAWAGVGRLITALALAALVCACVASPRRRATITGPRW